MKFLGTDRESADTPLRVIKTLLSGMSQNAFEYDGDSSARFRREIQIFLDSFSETLPPSEFLLQANAAVKCMSEYNQRASTDSRRRREEFDRIIRMLTATIAVIGSGAQASISKLQEIERQVSSASKISDIKTLRARLQECLEGIRNETERQRVDSARATAQLANEVERVTGLVATAGVPVFDQVTGLPPREAAMVAINALCANEGGSLVAVLMIEHLQLYNVRYGREVGDEILKSFVDSVRAEIPAGYALFRWGGPTLVATIENPGPSLQDARLELKRMLARIASQTIQSGSRSVTLSVTSRWTVFQAVPPAAVLLKKIEMFISLHDSAVISSIA